MERFNGDPDGLVQYFLDGYELIYRGDTFVIDEELQALGLTSNRQVETLEALVGMLSDTEKAPAARRLLERYTLERFETVDAWRAWLDESRGRIYFSDVGGYTFGVMPEGYLE